jgi:hypothetical protein
LHKIKQLLHKIKQNTIAKKYRYIGIICIFFPVSVFGFFQIPQQQRPRKHFESGGALAKRGTFVYDQNQMILCRSRAERKFFKIWSLYDVGNGLYRVFTAAKKALSFQQKRAFIQEILFFVL